jgi:hypothetical protein
MANTPLLPRNSIYTFAGIWTGIMALAVAVITFNPSASGSLWFNLVAFSWALWLFTALFSVTLEHPWVTNGTLRLILRQSIQILSFLALVSSAITIVMCYAAWHSLAASNSPPIRAVTWQLLLFIVALSDELIRSTKPKKGYEPRPTIPLRAVESHC